MGTPGWLTLWGEGALPSMWSDISGGGQRSGDQMLLVDEGLVTWGRMLYQELGQEARDGRQLSPMLWFCPLGWAGFLQVGSSK